MALAKPVLALLAIGAFAPTTWALERGLQRLAARVASSNSGRDVPPQEIVR